jgi:putative redox protein
MQKNAHLVLDSLEAPGLRFRARTDHGLEYVLDTGEDPRGPSPVDVLLAALGACTGMDVVSILRKKRVALTGYEIELRGERRDEHPRSFTRIEAIHRLFGPAIPQSAAEEALRLSETRYCSVHATLAPGVSLSSRIEIAEGPASPGG